MRSYDFRYRHGQSMPHATLDAIDDEDFFDAVVRQWEKKTGFKYVPGTVTCTVFEHRKVPEPAVSKSISSSIGVGRRWQGIPVASD